ncbi:flagellar biosynthesis protein FlhF [Steroidobacter sp. S1-65]|uniref:Flagellar biosynthesis protein FlhF n=1 Tax=Steroidobacter gossypii TaxID=2805490 RepID=A0ABS1X562_9GAMM|nr:flagellar biosynthesis protein FlhF [Steroidobacter gossypii]MBM0108345.1 flagellar biosynthesis protein FlhF [Steroidobacter gossypii]
MKIKHYRAADMRTALRQVRDAQGPDAVILSSRRVAGGVEVVAAIDYDGEEAATEQLTASAGRNVSYGASAQSGLVDTYGADRRGKEDSFAAPAQSGRDVSKSAPARAQHDTALFGGASKKRPTSEYASERAELPRHFADDRGTGYASMRGYAVESDPVRDVELPSLDLIDASSDVNEELRTLRRMLETQLATLAWNDLARRSPIQTELLKQLTQLGLAQDLATELVTQMPTRLEFAEANRLALALLARKIETTGERWMDSGGVVALVGATGVGKTTLIAKLAARWVLRHGPRDVALISTDSVRIGAQEQIQTLGRLLGVPAYAIDGAAELASVLEHVQDKRLVLIDTAGLSPRDPRLEQELALIAASSKRIETSLVLSAAAQAGAIEEAVQRFAPAQATTCMLTKLDEATSLGGAISTLIRARLPVTFVSEGQRVPEDLAPARAHQLIARAVDLSRKSGASADEDLLRRRFGTVAHAIA